MIASLADWASIATIAAAVCTVIGGVWVVIRGARKAFTASVVEIVDDRLEPLKVDVAAALAEVTYNGGNSVKDEQRRQGEILRQLADHAGIPRN